MVRLADLWPSFLGYVLSFVIIGFLWIQHHELFKLIISVDRTLLVLNIALLLTIAFMPFPTALVSEYIGHEGENIAKLIYSGWILVIAIIFNLCGAMPSQLIGDWWLLAMGNRSRG